MLDRVNIVTEQTKNHLIIFRTSRTIAAGKIAHENDERNNDKSDDIDDNKKSGQQQIKWRTKRLSKLIDD